MVAAVAGVRSEEPLSYYYFCALLHIFLIFFFILHTDGENRQLHNMLAPAPGPKAAPGRVKPVVF